jgi:hypothetical protein
MALKTTTELLIEVETAISKTLAGQAGTWDGKQLTMADLKTLYDIRSDLLTGLKVESGAPTIGRTRGRLNRE